jgi:hypothetical protein
MHWISFGLKTGLCLPLAVKNEVEAQMDGIVDNILDDAVKKPIGKLQ